MTDHPENTPAKSPRPDAGRPDAPPDPLSPEEAAILRDERQTERQAPDNANPGEAAGN